MAAATSAGGQDQASRRRSQYLTWSRPVHATHGRSIPHQKTEALLMRPACDLPRVAHLCGAYEASDIRARAAVAPFLLPTLTETISYQCSPGVALTGAVAALSTDPAASCDYTIPRCTAQARQGSRNHLPWIASVKIDYVAISGTHALAGFTDKICPPRAVNRAPGVPECLANTNPAAIFSARSATRWNSTYSRCPAHLAEGETQRTGWQALRVSVVEITTPLILGMVAFA